tara:strand:- start:55 stop:1206 length:1152 start_codon:yes stop_codon:yes gene_type:complete
MANTKIKNTVLDSSVISGQSTVTAASDDLVLIQDVSDSNNLKKALVSDFGSSFAGIDDQSSSNDDQLTITDSAVIINEDSDDVDFRVEGNGEANLLFVNAGDDKVGIGTASPAGKFHVSGHTSSVASIFESSGNGDTVPVQLKVKANDGTTSTQGLYGNAGSGSSNNTITFGNGSNDGLTIDASGQAEFKGTGNLVTFNASSGVTYVKFAENGTSRFFLATLNGSDGLAFVDADGGTERFRINQDGTLLPGANNSYNIGSSSLRISVLFTANAVNVSDQTLKKEIEDCDLGLSFINSLQPKSYKNKLSADEDLPNTHTDYGRKHYGLIAQDLKDGTLKDSVFGTKDGEYSLAYNDLIAPLIKALQEADDKIEALEARIATLEG